MQPVLQGLRPKQRLSASSLHEQANADLGLQACLRRCQSFGDQQTAMLAWLEHRYPTCGEDAKLFVTQRLLPKLVAGMREPAAAPVVEEQPAPASALPGMYRAWTDGSCLVNPGGAGAAASLVIAPNNQERRLVCGYRSTTNNRMELTAMLMALRIVPPGATLHIISDSQISVNKMDLSKLEWLERKNWNIGSKRETGNYDLWIKVLAVLRAKKLTVTASWVKGHAGDRNNTIVDEMANKAARAPASTLHQDEGFDTKPAVVVLEVPPLPDSFGDCVDRAVPDPTRVVQEDLDRAVELVRRLPWTNGAVPPADVRRKAVLEHLSIRRRELKRAAKQPAPAPTPIRSLSEEDMLSITSCFQNPFLAERDVRGWAGALMRVSALRPAADASTAQRYIRESVAACKAKTPPTLDMLGIYTCQLVANCFADIRNPQPTETDASLRLIRSKLDEVYSGFDRPFRTERLRLLKEIQEKFIKSLAKQATNS